MPIYNFKKPRRRQKIDDLSQELPEKTRFGSSDFIARREISSKSNSARRRIDDFSRSDGFYANRQPLIGPSQLRTDESLAQENSKPDHMSSKDGGSILQTENLNKKQSTAHSTFRQKLRKWTRLTLVAVIILLIIVGVFLLGKHYLKIH